MPQPSDLALWASDTNFASGTESGTPTKVDPGAAYEAQGGVPGQPFVAPYWNWALNNHSQWLQYLQGLHTDSFFLGQTLVWTAAQRFTGASRHAALQLVAEGSYTDADGASAPQTRVKRISFGSALQGQGDQPGSNGALGADGYASLETDPAGSSNFAQVSRAIELPQGAIVTGWKVLAKFDPGSLGNVTAQCALKRVAHDFTTPGLGSVSLVSANQTHTGTGNSLHVFQQSGLSQTVGATEQYWVFASITSSAVYRQTVELYGIEITYTETRATGSH